MFKILLLKQNADTSEHWMTAHSEAEARKKGSALLGIPEGDLTVCQGENWLFFIFVELFAI